MKKVAKLIIICDSEYLMLYRDKHPTFGNDPDLAGGTLEEGESLLETMIREVQEEIGVDVAQRTIEELYTGTDYSRHGTHYVLYRTYLDKKPNITISWEHVDYEWLDRDTFLHKSKNANDTYMHMVHDVMK